MFITADGYKIVTVTATGPASTTAVTAGAAADISLAVEDSPHNILEIIAVKRISGLPDGVVLAGWSATADAVTLRVFNPTAGNIDVTADSVTVELLAKAL